MNRILNVLVLVVLWLNGETISAATRTGDQSGWPVVQIRPAPNSNLGLLFDAGMRPYRFPRLENYSLGAKHVRILVTQPSGISLPVFVAELIDVDVKAGGLLASLVLNSPPETLSESRKRMLLWIGFGKNPIRTEADLDLFIQAVGKDYRGYNYGPNAISHNFSISWGGENEVRYSVWFQQARHPVTPLALRMGIAFPLTPIQEGTSYRSPIPPPPGYEDVDMTAPKDFGPDSPPEDPEVERIRKAGVMPDYSMLLKEKIPSGIRPQGHTAMPPQPGIPATVSSTWLWWLGGVAVFVLAFIGNALRHRRR